MVKMRKFWLLVATTMVVFTACEDDLGVSGEKQSDKIGFNVELNSIANGEWGGRSNDSLQHSDVQLETLNETLNGKPVYLFTITNDSIEPNIKGDRKEKKVQSRGSIVTNGGVQDMGVSAWVYNGELATDWNDVEGTKIYIDNDKLTSPNWSSSHSWTTAYDRMRFFAYSPYDAVKLPTTTGAPTFEYTIADKVVEQKDLLVASSDVLCPNDYKPAPITFAHALTAVKFEVANNVKNLVVKAVRVKGVYYKGSYTYEYCGINEADDDPDTPNSDTGSWDVVSDTEAVKDYEITLNNIECNGDGTGENVKLNENEYVLLLMPQTLPAGAMVEIDVTDKVLNRDVTLKSSIAGGVWGKGKQVTYCISANDEIVQYVFETENVSVPDYYGGEGVFTVKSYKKTTRFGGERIDPVAWDIVKFGDSDEKLSWINEIPLSGEGVSDENSVETIKYKMGAAPLEKSHTNEHISALAPKGTYNNPFDLSTNGGANAMNTANCYMVGYAGHYKLPLVYGNAIQNGKIPLNSGNAPLFNGGDYYDYKGKNYIQTPWITDNYTATSAYLVWQDAPGLVTNLRLVDDGKYVAFEIKKENACDGNAVIAVRDSENKIMWSWHIWVSHYVSMWEGYNMLCCSNGDIKEKTIYNKTYGKINDKGHLVNDAGKTLDTAPFEGWPEGIHGTYEFKLLSKYLGYCRGEEKIYRGDFSAMLKQREENGNTISLDVNDVYGWISTANNAVYYQFGRKDPFVGYGETLDASKTFQNKTCFGNDGKPVEFKYSTSAASSISETIQNPDVFYGSEATTWCNLGTGSLQFLWQAKNYNIPNGTTIRTLTDREPVVKTIYDPCPVGYEMPRSDAFTGFLLDNKSSDKQIQGNPEEYKGYFVDINVDPFYKYEKLSIPQEKIWESNSNNNGNILREPNPCAFVSGYQEYGYWFRPDVNGAGKFDGSFDAELDNEQKEMYDQCLLMFAFGCRGGSGTSNGSVKEYRHMGNALTATLVDKPNDGYDNVPSRLYFYHGHDGEYFGDEKTKNCRGHVEHSAQNGNDKTYTTFSGKSNQIITVATSQPSLGFTVLPAKTGANGTKYISTGVKIE